MAFRAQASPADSYSRAKAEARTIKTYVAGRIQLFSSATRADVLLTTVDELRQRRLNLLSHSGTPGLAQYARDQEIDQAYDVVAEFIAFADSLEAAITAIIDGFPKDGSGYLLAQSFNPDASRDYRMFTAAQLAGVRTALQAVDDAVALG